MTEIQKIQNELTSDIVELQCRYMVNIYGHKYLENSFKKDQKLGKIDLHLVNIYDFERKYLGNIFKKNQFSFGKFQ